MAENVRSSRRGGISPPVTADGYWAFLGHSGHRPLRNELTLCMRVAFLLSLQVNFGNYCTELCGI